MRGFTMDFGSYNRSAMVFQVPEHFCKDDFNKKTLVSET